MTQQLQVELANLQLQLEFAEMRLDSSKIRIEEFADSILDDVADKTILQSCRTVARAAGMKNRYIDAISFEHLGFLKGDVINDFTSDSKDALGRGLPLAKFFEDGTTTHFVEPLDPDGVLAWEDDAGITHFSKGHFVRGIRPMKIMNNGFKFGLERFKSELVSRINRFLQENSVSS